MARGLVQHPQADVRREVPVPEALERYRTAVGSQLEAALAPNTLDLYDILRYHLGWMDAEGHPLQAPAGKALRPALCLLTCHLAGGDWREALPAAVALELVHNFSLIHDDIQDGDTERRHRPTVWCIWGQAQAIGAGNAMRCLADNALAELAHTGTSAEVILELTSTLTARCLEMIEGQYLDLTFEERLEVSVEEYLDMVSRKTGALIDGAMHLGAFIATRDKATAATFGRCGRLLGLAFQIRDDILGIWGDADATGKATAADILRKKKTLPVVYTLEQTRGADGREIRDVYRKARLGADDVATVLRIMHQQQTHRYSQELAQDQCQKALRAIAELPLESWAQEELEEVASYLVDRER